MELEAISLVVGLAAAAQVAFYSTEAARRLISDRAAKKNDLDRTALELAIELIQQNRNAEAIRGLRSFEKDHGYLQGK
jgi:hypothetical protein